MTEDQVRDRLKEIKYPGFTRDIVSFGIIKEVLIEPQRCEIRLLMITEDADVISRIVADVEAAAASMDGLPPTEVVVERPQGSRKQEARAMADATGHGPSPVPGVARVVAVASGKGGVGKSTVAANLAVALARLGHRVGLLDADIYGPSVPTMFGVAAGERPGEDENGRLIPIERHGIKLCSMGFFVAPGAPLIWRGPMLTKALGQFLGDVTWGELDYLLLDLPPGTGDVQMTLMQSVRLDGGVIVTTPQDVALVDVERGIKMFQDAAAPVIGVVENMAVHVCPGCGHEAHIFGDGGGLKVSARFEVPLLGSIPLLRSIRAAADAGTPVVVSDPEGAAAKVYTDVAHAVMTNAPATEVGHA